MNRARAHLAAITHSYGKDSKVYDGWVRDIESIFPYSGGKRTSNASIAALNSILPMRPKAWKK